MIKLVNHTDDLRVNWTWQFWGGFKSYRRFEGKLDLAILGRGGVNHTDDLMVNRTWQFRGGGKLYRRFEGKSDLAISGG